jgi:uncharacterized protein (TIGR03437 family)
LSFSRLVVLLPCAAALAAADYTTYIGDTYAYQVTAITADANGNTYVTGSRAVTATLNDVFVSQLDTSGNVTLLATFSGKGSDQAKGIALDASGNIYIVGNTTSPDFPLLHPLQSVPSRSGATGFLVKLRADGTVLYSTYLGGTAGPSTLNAVAADAQGNAYVTGETFASDYPRTSGLPASGAAGPGPGAYSAAFFAEISAGGNRILYAGGVGAGGRACGEGSTCFLSTLSNAGTGIAVDPAGNAYIAGNTYGTGLPTTPGALQTEGIGAFVAKVNAAGTGLAYLTLLGTANNIIGGPYPNSAPATLVYAIAADGAGNAYLAGTTSDPHFPATPGAFQSTLPVPPNSPYFPPASAFLAKLNPTGSAMVWATFLGGASSAGTVAVDSAGDVWASGAPASTDFPASSGFPGGKEFLAEVNSSGSSLSYAALFPANTVAAALAVDPAGTVHFAGATGIVGTLTPGQNAAARILGVANAAGGDLAGRVAPGELISLYGLNLGPSAPATATFNASGFLPTTLAGVQVTIGGTPAPLLYVSATQINAVVPFELVNLASAPLVVTGNETALPDFHLAVDQAIPAVFQGALNQDGTVNSTANPAKAGSIVSIWATGVGWFGGAIDGQMATAAQDFHCCFVQEFYQNQLVVPAYAGAAPGLVAGVVQVNFQVTTVGEIYYLTAGSSSRSNHFSIAVTQ